MQYLKIAAVLLFSLVLSAKLTPEDEIRIEKQKLIFIENNIYDILSKVAVPEMYGATADKLIYCGCSHSAHNIMWGEVGMQCKVTDPDKYWRNKDSCNLRCLSPKGQEIMLFCPEGFVYDCVRGCIAPEDFTKTQERVDFLETVVDLVVRFAFDYLEVDSEYLQLCGCTGALRVVEYGSKVGLDCIYEEENVDVTECAAFNGCADNDGNKIAVFCPAGHKSSCSGCTKDVLTPEVEASKDLDLKRRARLDWMTNVLTGWIRESFSVLGLEPDHTQVLACGCKDELHPILYGNQVGYYCAVSDPDSVTEECGPNVFCENSDGSLLLHLCPSGFTPNCTTGCGFSWEQEEEKEEL